MEDNRFEAEAEKLKIDGLNHLTIFLKSCGTIPTYEEDLE